MANYLLKNVGPQRVREELSERLRNWDDDRIIRGLFKLFDESVLLSDREREVLDERLETEFFWIFMIWLEKDLRGFRYDELDID